MSTMEPKKTFCIYDSRIATMVSSNTMMEEEKEEVETTIRLARFLKPCAKNIPPLMHPQDQEKKNHPHPKLHFNGWKNPQTKWGDWVETLTPKHAFIWNQTGICDAILSSLYEFPRNPTLILALVNFWSPKTNTFVFPWGEATITLEDIVILGGFSVLGEPVTLPLSSDMFSIEAQLVELRRRMWKNKSKKPDHQSWLKLFTDGEFESQSHEELEHVGFLSLWLSRFVFPSISGSTIETRVFPIAIHLSQGKRMALALPVLASIYHNLSLLKEQLVSSSEIVTVAGPFQLVQQWAFERFPILVGPNCPNELKPGEPRAARWHRLKNSCDSFSSILSSLKSARNFQWRPYVADLKNWCFVSNYIDNEQFVVVDDGASNLAEELKSFGVCLCADELVGLDCVEKYMPYRVAMQFGIDQDVPAEDFSISCKGNFSFYVPAKCYKPCVSLEYFNWWKKSKLVGEKMKLEDFDLLCPIKTSTTALDKTCMLDVLMIAKQYCEEEEEESHASTDSIDQSSSKRKLSSKDKEVVESNISRALKKKKNDPSLFITQGKQEDGVGTYHNPLDIEDYVFTTLGTLSHPINIDNYM